MKLKHTQPRRRARGFSLVEVLIALLVISIGLLGIAKMQALALANTNGGRLRALAAIEAASLEATMHAERNYWGSFTTNQVMNITGSGTSAVVNSTTDATVNGTVTCTATTATTIGTCTGPMSCVYGAAACTAQQIAAYDLQQWAGRLQQVMTTDAAQIQCLVTTTTPVACTITINWAEEQVNSTSSQTLNMAGPTYVLSVNP